MRFDFDTCAEHHGFGSMRQIVKPAKVEAAGLPSYDGAEMDFLTCPSISESVVKRALHSSPSFTLCDEPYRKAVVWWMQSQRGLSIDKDWIVPTHGTIFTLATLIRMLVGPEDGIIIQTPTYNRYEQAADRLGRKTFRAPLKAVGNDYSLDFETLERLMAREDAKLLVLCNPNNPTGNIWSAEELERIASLARRHGVFVYCDEIFAEVCFDERCPSYCAVPGTEDNSVTVTSLGKCFNCTGVNHANVLIRDEALRERFIRQRYADHYGSMDPWAYSAVMGAYSPDGAAWKDEMLEYVRENARVMSEFFREHMPAVTHSPIRSSFMLWVDWSGLGLEEDELLDFLENEALFNIGPGKEYYEDRPCLTRISIAVPRRSLLNTLDKLLSAAKNRNLAM